VVPGDWAGTFIHSRNGQIYWKVFAKSLTTDVSLIQMMISAAKQSKYFLEQ